MKKQVIGLSVSLCIADIVSKKIKPEDVTKIIGSTAFETDADWERGAAEYSRAEWQGSNPTACTKMMFRLRQEGKIEQPRLTNPDFNTWGRVIKGHWLVDGVQKFNPN